MGNKLLIIDLKYIKALLEYYKKHNFRVLSGNYVDPAVDEKTILPINHYDGIINYLTRIQATLVKAIRFGTLDRKELPPSAPYYLEQMVEEDPFATNIF